MKRRVTTCSDCAKDLRLREGLEKSIVEKKRNIKIIKEKLFMQSCSDPAGFSAYHIILEFWIRGFHLKGHMALNFMRFYTEVRPWRNGAFVLVCSSCKTI